MQTNPFSKSYVSRPSTYMCDQTSVLFQDGHNSFVDSTFTCLKNVVFTECDKNFVYYNSNLSPHLENIIIDAHPCEPCVLQKSNMDRLIENGRTHTIQPQIYLERTFYEYYVASRKRNREYAWDDGNEENVHCFDGEELKQWMDHTNFVDIDLY